MARSIRKHDSARILDELIAQGERLVVDVEVLQEIMHRYLAINRPDAIQPAFDAVLELADEVLSVNLGEVEEAKRLVLGGYGVTARDALHVAVMRSNQITRIVSFDARFDRIPGIDRLY